MISVVVAAYNGEKYIEEQLYSIMNQSLKPDEVIICDDNSKDNTVEVVNNFIRLNKLKGWRVIRHVPGLGVTKNFYSGAESSKGDVVFFSDQDDTWHKDKIRKMTDLMKKTNALVVTCRRRLVDHEGHEIKSISNRMRYPFCFLKKYKKNNFYTELKYLTSSGLCTAFRKSLFAEVKELVTSSKSVYDLPFGISAAFYDRCVFMNEILVDHRVHTDNLSRPMGGILDRKGKYDRQIDARMTKINILDGVLQYYYDELDKKQISDISEALEIHRSYIDCLNRRDKRKAIHLLFRRNPIVNKNYGIADIICLMK